MSFPLVSVIINNFKGVDKLRTCLSSIQESNYPNFEVIVSDCMTSGIKAWIKENYPEVKLISFEKDVGPAASRNEGLSITNPASKYVVFVDNDTETTSEWLRNLIVAMENRPEVGAAQPLLLKMSDPKEVDSMGGFFDYIGYACLSPFLFKTNMCEFRSTLNICYCEAITAIRRDALSQLQDSSKPYDPTYFQHWEDIDMCWEIMLSGYRVVLIRDSIVFHRRGVSAGLGLQSANLVFLNTRNRLTTLIKNYDIQNLTKYVTILILLELMKGTFLFRNNKTHAVSTFKGIIWNLGNLREIWKKRVDIQVRVRKISDCNIKKMLVRPSITRMLSDFRRHYG